MKLSGKCATCVKIYECRIEKCLPFVEDCPDYKDIEEVL